MRYFEAAIDYTLDQTLDATQNARVHMKNGHEQ